MSFSTTIPAIASALSYAYAPATRRCAIGGDDGSVAVYELPATSIWVARQCEWHPDEVYALAWSPDGRTLASSGLGCTIKVWDAEGHLSQEWDAHMDSAIIDLAWSPDGAYLVSAGNDGKVHVWAMGSTTHILMSTYDHDLYVASVAWSPDGQVLASGNNLGEIVLSNPLTGSHIQTYTGVLASDPDNLEMNEINALAWSPDGAYLAASQTTVGGNNGLLQVFSGPRDPILVYNPEFSHGCGWQSRRLVWANGKTILAADMDGCIHQLQCSADGQALEALHLRYAPVGEAICFFDEKTYITTAQLPPFEI